MEPPLSTTRVSEYDAFGPWIDEVLVPEDVPRLFRDHALDLDAARLVLKVPREIARRDATPDMDLYDYLLVLDPARLTVLKRHGAGSLHRAKDPGRGGYDVMTVPLDEVVAIRDVVSLLDASLTIHTASGSAVSIRYNGSARANVNKLVGRLRVAATACPPGVVGRGLLAAARPVVGGSLGLDPGKADLTFVSGFADLSRSNPDLVAWACHGRLTLAPGTGGSGGLVQRALHAFSPMTLHGGLLASDGTALEVLGRHEWLVRGRTPVHSTSRLVVSFSALERLNVETHPLYVDAMVAHLTAGRTTLDLVVPTGSEAGRVLSEAASAPSTD
jgi:hypothetical protein